MSQPQPHISSYHGHYNCRQYRHPGVIHIFDIHYSDMLLKLIQNRFAANLRYLELPCDLITREVLQELANRSARQLGALKVILS